VELARQLEKAGISWLTVHGRTKGERAEPVHLDYIKTIVDAVDIPVIANGDVDSLSKAQLVQEVTGARGVMSARGILDNPALFSGHTQIPPNCILRWMDINAKLDSHFTMFHRHLIHMLSSQLNKTEKRYFNYLTQKSDVIDFIQDRFGHSVSISESDTT